MNHRSLLALAVAVAVTAATARAAQAQYVTFYAPPVAVPATYFAPAAPVYTVAYAAPTCAAPLPAPVPVVTYFRPPVVGWAPTAQVVTRRRPILGGTVSRVRYAYAPVVY